MINYQLAKQLKDAGYSQEMGEGVMVSPVIFDKKKCVYKPTLSELIDACGEEFVALIAPTVIEKRWSAVRLLRTDLFGKTPEEAVAKLWIKLNEQKPR